MSRTRIIFFAILGFALVSVAVGLIAFAFLGRRETTVSLTGGSEPLDVTIVAALSVEPWVSRSAKQFNEEGHSLEGRPIRVDVIAMDGLAAMGRYEREEMDPLPTAWIARSRTNWTNKALSIPSRESV